MVINMNRINLKIRNDKIARKTQIFKNYAK